LANEVSFSRAESGIAKFSRLDDKSFARFPRLQVVDRMNIASEKNVVYLKSVYKTAYRQLIMVAS